MKIKNWNEFQHYKDRNPAWIKLHRTLLDDREFISLEHRASKLLVMCYLLASEDKLMQGNLPCLEDIAFRTRMSLEDVKASILKLNHWILMDDSDLLADCKQSASPEERRGETEKETKLKKTKAKKSLNRWSLVLDEVCEIYKTQLKSTGISTGRKSLEKILKKGQYSPEQLLNSVKNYKNFLKTKQDHDDQYTTQMNNFFGQKQIFLDYLSPVESDIPLRAPQEPTMPRWSDE